MKKYILSLFILFLSFIVRAYSQNPNCLSFDGTDDQVIVPGASALIAGSTAMTIACWVYPTNTTAIFPDFDGFCGFRDNAFADFYMVQFGVGRVEARFRNDLGVNVDIVDTGMQVNVWQHYALVYSEPELSLYRNGVLVGTTTATGTISSTLETFYIGNLPFQTFNYWLTGKLDEVSLWNRALSPSEIQCMMTSSINPTSDSLKLYFNFNQGIAAGNNATETTLFDRSLHLDGSLDGFALTGFTSNYVPGVNNVTSTVRQLCPGDSIVFGGQTIYSAGNYTGTYAVSPICDSVVYLSVSQTDTSVIENGMQLIANQPGALYQWLDCDNGYAPISGAVTRGFTPPGDGNYAVIVNQGSCRDTSGCHYVLINSISSLSVSGVFVFPNPVDEQINMRFEKASDIGKIEITDASGRLVFVTNEIHQSALSIPCSSWNSGLYNVTVYTTNGVRNMRLLHR